ncbi:PEP-CTERM sorting domain-containing protein [Geminocystis sp.]|uniref:PEP-CTERM sorting domain-containing protein n=1 Tax=Geminocystis sp. TaxID=2664100 RepID=UPI0035933511
MIKSSSNKGFGKIAGIAVISFFTYGGSANAIQITPTSVTASSQFSNLAKVNNLINNSGLSGGNHNIVPLNNMWVSINNDINPTVTFNLGAVYNLTGSDIWNFNASGSLNRGVKDFNILTSLDGNTFSSAGSGTLSIGTGNPLPSQLVAFTATAQYVRFNVISNYGNTTNTGLSEVKFQGTLAPTSVPEPLTILGSLTALGFGSVFKKKFKSSKS